MKKKSVLTEKENAIMKNSLVNLKNREKKETMKTLLLSNYDQKTIYCCEHFVVVYAPWILK